MLKDMQAFCQPKSIPRSYNHANEIWLGTLGMVQTSAFLPGPPLHIAGAASAPLAGLTFAAKDLFDVVAHPAGEHSKLWVLIGSG